MFSSRKYYQIKVKALLETCLYTLPELHTERLKLRPLYRRDARDLFETCRDPQVARYVLWEAHSSLSQTRQYIRYARRQYRRGEAPTFAIELKEAGKVIGTLSFLWIDRENRSAEVGYSLGQAWWGRGYATEALKRAIACAFEEWGLNRVEAQHDVANPASGRVMQKAGMKQEGVLRQRVYNKGRFVDVALYAILRKDDRR